MVRGWGLSGVTTVVASVVVVGVGVGCASWLVLGAGDGEGWNWLFLFGSGVGGVAVGLVFGVGLEDSRELFLVGLSLGLKLCRDLYLVLGGELMARSRLSVPFVSDVSIGRLPWE